MIEKLSNEQVEKIKEYETKYINIGLDTKPIDRDNINNIINEIYEVLLNKQKPERIVICNSPLEAFKFICNEINVKINNFVWPYFSGSFDANIFAFYDYFINELNIKIDSDLLKKYNVWKKTINLGLIYVFDDVCIVTEKPIIIRRNSRGLLHCENGPAVQYKDGFEVYALNGVRMPKEYVMTPWNELDASIIVKEKNAEIRRELVRKMGIEKVCNELNAKIIDKRDNYELLLLDIGDGLKRPYLKMINPSIGVYHIEGVHPKCKTVEEALNWRNETNEKPLILT